jgi:hypothetical protein
VKILRITTSEDSEPRVPELERTPAVAARVITDLTGEPVENVQRVFWPTADFPDVVSRWLGKYRPDVVFMVVTSYAFTFESVPLRLERRLGRAGRLINARAQQVAGIHTISDRQVFRLARKGAFRLIGADAHFTPREVLDTTEAAIRRILAFEDVVLAVRGPRRPLAVDGGTRAITRAERKRQFVNTGLKAICAKHHVALHVFEQPPFATDDDDRTFGDRIHANASAQLVEGELQGEFIAKAWLAAHGCTAE